MIVGFSSIRVRIGGDLMLRRELLLQGQSAGLILIQLRAFGEQPLKMIGSEVFS
jgi:hypothetical protein